MTPDEIQARTRSFALRTLKLVDALPTTPAGRAVGNQLLRLAMSVSANYRAARRARSRKEFVAKLGLVVEEADETEHWLDLVTASEMLPQQRVEDLHNESIELMKIFSATRTSARRKKSPDRQIAKSPNRQI